jgi:hypothetical protein
MPRLVKRFCPRGTGGFHSSEGTVLDRATSAEGIEARKHADRAYREDSADNRCGNGIEVGCASSYQKSQLLLSPLEQWRVNQERRSMRREMPSLGRRLMAGLRAISSDAPMGGLNRQSRAIVARERTPSIHARPSPMH